MTFAPAFEAAALTKEATFQSVWNAVPYNAQRFAEETNRLYALLQGFLAQGYWEGQARQGSLSTLAAMRQRGLSRHFELKAKALQKDLDQAAYRDANYHFQQFRLADLSNDHFGHQQLRKVDHSLQAKSHHLDQYYLITKLRDSCELLNRAYVLNTPYDLGLLERLMAAEDFSIYESPAVQVYWHILKMLQTDAADHFHHLVALLEAHVANFPPQEIRGLYKYAQNYCVRQVNRGNYDFYQQLFALYQQQLASGVIFEQNQLAHTDYKNIVTIGLRLKAYDWVADFMEENRERVLPAFRENVYQYSRAAFLLEKGQLREAVRLLHQTEFPDLQYLISAKYLQLKAYYELEDHEGLLYLITSFKSFLRRTKSISPQNRSNHFTFLRLLKKITVLRERKGIIPEKRFQERWKAISAELGGEEKTPHRQWLGRVLGEMGE